MDQVAPIQNTNVQAEVKSDGGNSNTQTAMIVFCGIVTVASLTAAIVLGLSKPAAPITITPPAVIVNTGSAGDTVIDQNTFSSRQPRAGINICEGKTVKFDNVDCLIDAIENVLPQSGGNVTMGFKGELNVGHQPITSPYFQNDMCAVNVHWHLGSEHLSVGEYDEQGSGPSTKPGDLNRKLVDKHEKEEVRGGFRCHHYDENDEKFTKPYEWQHCLGMEVGETYEVHWPHSAAGACGTPIPDSIPRRCSLQH